MGLDRIICTARCFVLFLPSPWLKDICEHWCFAAYLVIAYDARWKFRLQFMRTSLHYYMAHIACIQFNSV